MPTATPLTSLLVDIMLELQAALRTELEAQGHSNTGKLSDSISFEVSQDGSVAVGLMYFEDYGLFVNVGVNAQNIPFGKGGSKGGTSKYIQGLVEFWESKGLSGREALSAAFATARVHAREGMPSRASFAYSRTGERIGFVQDAIERKVVEIEGTIQERFGTTLQLQVAEAVASLENVSTG
jgi:hypothetical protein